MTESHDEITSLLGAYALDAVEVEEATQVELHVGQCPRCNAELLEYQTTAPMLGSLGGEAPDGLWEAVLASIDQPSSSGMQRSVLRATRPTSRRRLYAFGAAAVAVAAAVVLLAVSVAGLEGRVNHLQGESVAQALRRAESSALARPGHTVVYLRAATGATPAHVVVANNGSAYLVNDSLPKLSAGRTYQLWALSRGTPVSLGVLGREPTLTSFEVQRGMTMVMLTAEPSGGVPQPDSPVIASGALTNT
ncbi:MAG TPA: anti-sigma factor [Acidimicrobiales bacterium]|nr:anti-sigma factor [Acidimicrobiales bacterium]